MRDFLLNLATATVAFLAPIRQLMVLTGALIAIDLLTGVMAAKKRGEDISSTRMKDTVLKCLTYQMAIISGFIVQTHFVPDLPIVKLISAVIGMTELKSILENAESITQVDLVKSIMAKMAGNSKPRRKRK